MTDNFKTEAVEPTTRSDARKPESPSELSDVELNSVQGGRPQVQQDFQGDGAQVRQNYGKDGYKLVHIDVYK